MVHSLQSCNYMKIEESNCLKFGQIKKGELNRPVTIQEQQLDRHQNTYYDEIYYLDMKEMTLQQLVLIQSIFQQESYQNIIDLINLQPDLRLFFKSFLELDHANLV